MHSRLVMLPTPPGCCSLALFAALFAPIPTPPFCRTPTPPHFLLHYRRCQSCLLFGANRRHHRRVASLRPPRCVTSLCAHPSDAKAVAQCPLDAYRHLSIAHLAASCVAWQCMLDVHLVRTKLIALAVQPLATYGGVSCAPPQTGSLLRNGQAESTPVAD